MSTTCIICEDQSDFFFVKKYNHPYCALLQKAEFYKCRHCGFSFSNTLYDMTQNEWERINIGFHSQIENKSVVRDSYKRHQPPYYEQSFLIKVLAEAQLIDTTSMIDYGGGVGTLEHILDRYFHINMPVYDPYMKADDPICNYLNSPDARQYRALYNSALFEHLRRREDYDAMNALVASDGCMIVHTVVCENIPQDPDWFYIKTPAHCSLFTNRSMSILMEQYGYKCSLYCPPAKSWVLFKDVSADIRQAAHDINIMFQTDYLYFKEVDYWKGF